MVMTAGAGDCQSQNGLGRHIYLLIGEVGSRSAPPIKGKSHVCLGPDGRERTPEEQSALSDWLDAVLAGGLLTEADLPTPTDGDRRAPRT